MAYRNMREIESGQVLMLPQRFEVQWVQEKVLDKMKGVKDFDHIQKKRNSEMADKQQSREQSKKLEIDNCKHCSIVHRQYLTCGGHAVLGKQNHFKAACQISRGLMKAQLAPQHP